MQEINKDLKQSKDLAEKQVSTNYEYLLNARKAAVNSQKEEEFKWLTEHSRNFPCGWLCA